MSVNLIKLEDCKFRDIYLLKSRNLLLGVYNGRGGFIGIREKFGYRYLDTEYYRDEKTGTAIPTELVQVSLLDHIEVVESLGTFCTECKRPGYNIYNGSKWIFNHYNTLVNVYDEKIDSYVKIPFLSEECNNDRGMVLGNYLLFNFLQELEISREN